MSSEQKDILDYNVTLGALRVLLNTVLTEKQVNIDFLKKYVAINKFDLVNDSINFLEMLQIIKSSPKGELIPKISRNELSSLRATILNRMMVSTNPHVHYLTYFLDRFFSSQEMYYEQREVWRILVTARSHANIRSPGEVLTFKFKLLIRHLKEFGLAITYKEIIIPVVDPSLILEIVKHMQFFKGSLYEFMSKLNDNYLPCYDIHRKPYTPLINSLEYLEKTGFVRLSSKSDAGLEYRIGEKGCNFLEVISHEN
ncbi:MAG: hypothetical protein QXU45_02500 [Candidatus Bathyarchaeia archaeon]